MKTTWTAADFDDLSWHDDHVHALRIIEGEHGSGELVLDLDHIVEWLEPSDGQCRFLLAPATLTFHDITDLRITIDYASPTAAIAPMSIGEIAREPLVYPNGHRTFRWRVLVNWPAGKLTFQSPGFTQVLRAQPVVTEKQRFDPKERAPETA